MLQAYTAVDADGQLALHRLERGHAAAHVALADESQVPALVDRKHEEAAAGRCILLRLDKAGACIGFEACCGTGSNFGTTEKSSLSMELCVPTT